MTGDLCGRRPARWSPEAVRYLTDKEEDVHRANGTDPRGPNARFIAAANPATVLALLAERDRLRAALEAINRLASPSPYRTFDECSADLNWCANEARRALAPTPAPQS